MDPILQVTLETVRVLEVFAHSERHGVRDLGGAVTVGPVRPAVLHPRA